MTAAVVLPVGEDSLLLADCLDSLLAQTPRPEVVVVDDSRNGTLSIRAESVGADIRVLRSGGVGPYAARNLGWQASEAEIVLFTDVRCRARPGWLASMTAPFHQSTTALVAGEVRVLSGPTLAARSSAVQQFFRISNYVENAYFRPYFPTCNLAVRRTALEAVGGFPQVRSGGDAELCWRVLADPGRELVTLQDGCMDWLPRSRVRDLLEQNYRYGKSNSELRRRWLAEGCPQRAALPLPRLAAMVMKHGLRCTMAATQGLDVQAEKLQALSWAAFEAGYAMGERQRR